MKAKRTVLGTVIVCLALSVAAPAAASENGAAMAAHSAATASRPGLLSWLLERFERPEREPPRNNRPSAVPELGAQGAAPAVLVVLAGAAILVARRRQPVQS